MIPKHGLILLKGNYNLSVCVFCMPLLFALSKASGKKAADNKGKKSKQPALTYTAARLHEKGVLLEIEDLPITQYAQFQTPHT